MDKLLPHTPSLKGDDIYAKRQEIKSYFSTVYDLYESLFSLLNSEEAYYQRADMLRHPLIFYYGHTATFFINKLRLAKIINERIDPRLESIFAVGVDEMSWDDLDKKHYDWPSLQETQSYRDQVRKDILKLMDTLPLTLPITDSSPWWIILMGIEHENIHIETSSVLMRQLPIKWIRSSPQWQDCTDVGNAPTNQLISIPEGNISLGKNHNDDYYGWDNEYGKHDAIVHSFSASKYLVSNAEFLPFVESDAYEDESYWEAEGWSWRCFIGVSHPSFWITSEDGYRLRTLTQEIDLPMNWAVEVNYHEAKAFCNWLGKQRGESILLPSEDEYMRLLDITKVNENTPANIRLKNSSPVPIDSYAHGDFYDLVGNVWQWSRTPIYPFEGFSVHPIYDDFTVPTYDGKHNLIKGGSWVSCGNVASPLSRYAFRRHFFQHAGFRYVKSRAIESKSDDGYESDLLIAQYCHFSWGERYFDVPNYPQTCADIALQLMASKARRKALDLGCAIGRSSFELARGFESVVGIDFSTRFIRHAETMKQSGHLRYTLPTEGDLEAYYEAELSSFGLSDVTDRVEFWQGDACNLKPHLKDFDLIFAGNLIDRLYDPYKLLDTIHERILSGGLLILTSPYTWQEESTPKDKWIGGYKKDGENLSTIDGLLEILGKNFSLLERRDIPFVIRETKRKFQHTIAEMSVWERV